MAQTKKRRRRKHRGTQGGSIDTARRGPRPRSRAEARAQAKSQMSKRKSSKGSSRTTAQRRNVAPSWRSAVNRAAMGSLIFLALLFLIFKQPAAKAVPLAAFMFAVYIPMGHAIDTFFYKRRLAHERRSRERDGRT